MLKELIQRNVTNGLGFHETYRNLVDGGTPDWYAEAIITVQNLPHSGNIFAGTGYDDLERAYDELILQEHFGFMDSRTGEGCQGDGENMPEEIIEIRVQMTKLAKAPRPQSSVRWYSEE